MRKSVFLRLKIPSFKCVQFFSKCWALQRVGCPTSPGAVTRTGRLMDETGRGPSMLNLERFEFKELGFIFSHGLNRESEKFKFSMISVFLMAEEIYIS